MKVNRDLYRYLRDVSRVIPVKGKDKRKFIKTLKQRILDNEIYNENMTYKDIEKCYGTAKEVGIGFLDGADNETLLNRINYSLFMKRLALVITVIACLSFMCASAFRIYRLECLYKDVESSLNGYYTEEIEEYSNSEIQEDEVIQE